jgi:hypothetical protein
LELYAVLKNTNNTRSIPLPGGLKSIVVPTELGLVHVLPKEL